MGKGEIERLNDFLVALNDFLLLRAIDVNEKGVHVFDNARLRVNQRYDTFCYTG